ncbi:MAG: ATP-binding protein [Litorimonas sp.]
MQGSGETYAHIHEFVASAVLIRTLTALLLCLYIGLTQSTVLGGMVLLLIGVCMAAEIRTYSHYAGRAGERKSRGRMMAATGAVTVAFALPTLLIASHVTVASGYIAAIYASAALIFQITGYGRTRKLALIATLPHGIGLVISGAVICFHYMQAGNVLMGATVMLCAPVYVYMIVQLHNEITGRDERLRAAAESAVAQSHESETHRMRAEAANIAKGNFLASMSHEIRTPMNGILGLADMLCQMDTDPDVKRSTRIIQTSAEALMVILNDILDFSKLDAGCMELDPAPFDIAATVDAVVSLIQTKLDPDCVTISHHIAPGMPKRLVGDDGRIRQILLNLVGNAAKFTHQGHISVRAEWFEPASPGAPVGVRVSVSDTGIGIDPAEIERIFERFSQASSGTTRAYDGTGLGLSICRELATLMGGRVGAVSAPGKGSTFYLDVLLPQVSQEPTVADMAA